MASFCELVRRDSVPRPCGERSFRERVIASRLEHIHRIRATDSTGRRAYYFVYVPPANRRAFLAMLETNAPFDLGDFGEIIASCYGEEPTDAVRSQLLKKYGFSA